MKLTMTNSETFLGQGSAAGNYEGRYCKCRRPCWKQLEETHARLWLRSKSGKRWEIKKGGKSKGGIWKKVGKYKGGRLKKMGKVKVGDWKGGKVKVGKGGRLKRWENKSGKRWEIEKGGESKSGNLWFVARQTWKMECNFLRRKKSIGKQIFSKDLKS